MNIVVMALLLLISTAPDSGKTAARTRNFSATTDKNGNQHNATAQINANGTIRCTSATGANPRTNPPACFVMTTHGGSMRLTPGQEMGTASGGTMTLTCNGQAPLACSVSIVD